MFVWLLCRLETEGRQLHQVIAQLRQARRSNQESADTAQADRESYQSTIASQQRELDTLRGAQRQLLLAESARDSAVRSSSLLGAEVSALEDRLEEAVRQAARQESRAYEAESRLEAAQSAELILRHDLSLRTLELENLHAALSSIEKECESRVRGVRNEHQKKILSLEEEWHERSESEKEALLQDADFYRQKVQLAEERAQDEVLLRRRLEMDMSAEKRRLSGALEEALHRLQHSQEDVVDRTLVKNLVVTYFRQKR